jgi:hypothetical protein
MKFKAYLENALERTTSKAFDLGNALDVYFTEPDKFCTLDVSKPDTTSKIGKFIEAYCQYITGDAFKIYRIGQSEDHIRVKAFIYARKEADFSPKYTDDTISKNFKESGGQEYLNALVENKGKTFVTPSEMKILKSIRDNLALKPDVEAWLLGNPIQSENVEIFNQLILEDEVEIHAALEPVLVTLPVKGKMDRVIVDHTNKIIYLIDYKTTSSGVYNFNKSYSSYKYYRQTAFYKMLLEKKYSGYTVLSKMIVSETTFPYSTVLFEVDSTWVTYGTQEIANILSRIAYHWHTDNFFRSIEEIENNNEITLTRPSYIN